VDCCLQGFQNFYEEEKYPLFDHLFRGGGLDRYTVHRSIRRRQTQWSGFTSNLSQCFLVPVCHWRPLAPVGIAAYSLIGEKVQKSLEPLLATPTTDEEILAGKSIAAFLPAIGANYIGALIFTVLVDLFTYNILKTLYFPNWDFAIILFLLAPLACILSVGYNVLVSSRSNDVRTAQQLGTLILLPFGAVYLLSELKVMTLTTDNMLIMAAVLAVIDGIVFYLVKATFQREEILTKWK
jgi:ABC-2 type transport system permease protein